MLSVVIYGAGGLGREIFDTLMFINAKKLAYNVVGYIDDTREPGSVVNGVSVLGGCSELAKMHGKVEIILGIAVPAVRKELHARYKKDFLFPNIIHPTAFVSPFAELGEAILIQSNCIIAANAKIGDGVMMNAHSGVGHDAQVDEYCSIMSYCDLAGNTRLGELSFVGTGVKVIPLTSIAAESYLCAGAVVFKDVLNKSKLLGNPAKIIG
jgi:sugar O-acyltransferase (sialic acid O-acetyltransferase NeuD family)